MSFLSSILHWFGDLFHAAGGTKAVDDAVTDVRNSLKNSLFASKRFISLIAFAALAFFVFHGAFEGYNFAVLGLVLAVYLLGESYANGKLSQSNGEIRVAEINAARDVNVTRILTDRDTLVAKLRSVTPAAVVTVTPPTTTSTTAP